MRLFGVALLFGALLGVVNADSTVRKGENRFLLRSLIADIGINPPNDIWVRATKFDPNLRGDPNFENCDNVNYKLGTENYYFHLSVYSPQFPPGNYTYFDVDQSVGLNAAVAGVGITANVATFTASGFGAVGKYRMCACFGGNVPSFCEKAPAVQPLGVQTGGVAPGGPTNVGTKYLQNFGYLHIVDSVSQVGPHPSTFFASFEPTVPVVVLQASNFGGDSASVSASWLMRNRDPVQTVYDQFMIIDTSSLSIGEPALGGFQCGNTHYDNIIDNENLLINVSSSAVVTPVNSPGCTTSLATLSPLEGSAGATLCTLDNYVLTSAQYTAPSYNTSITNNFAKGYICFCDFEVQGNCNDPSRFGAALGPIMYREFTVSDQKKHFTVQSAVAQFIDIKSRAGANFTQADKLGLVRQDTTTGLPIDYSFDYTTLSHRRGCGWSNLDPSPTVAFPRIPAVYTFTQYDRITSSPVFPSQAQPQEIITFQFDFAQVHTRRYEMCLCQASFIQTVTNTIVGDRRLPAVSFAGTGCPNPQDANPTSALALRTNDNYQNSFFEPLLFGICWYSPRCERPRP